MRKRFTLICVCVIIFSFVNARTINTITESVKKNDSIVIRLNDYTGTIQWQDSTNNSKWTNIPNATFDTLLFVADETTYFKALVTTGICEPFVSDIAKIIVDNNVVENPSEYQLTIKYPGVSSVGMNAVFISWVEDEEENNIQNLYICNKIKADMTTNTSTFTGIPLPYWRKEKSASIDWDDVDGITGASIQTATNITRSLSIVPNTKIRICFEIDRSANGNDYFTDRPCFIYKSELIDLTSLEENYELVLEGFMSNDTEHATYGQTPPLIDIPDFKVWKYMSDTSYIAPLDMFIDETQEHSNLIIVIKEL